MFVGIGLITVPLTIFLYITINKRRAKLIEELGGPEGLAKRYSVAELREMGDRAPDFVYTLWRRPGHVSIELDYIVLLYSFVCIKWDHSAQFAVGTQRGDQGVGMLPVLDVNVNVLFLTSVVSRRSSIVALAARSERGSHYPATAVVHYMSTWKYIL